MLNIGIDFGFYEIVLYYNEHEFESEHSVLLYKNNKIIKSFYNYIDDILNSYSKAIYLTDVYDAIKNDKYIKFNYEISEVKINPFVFIIYLLKLMYNKVQSSSNILFDKINKIVFAVPNNETTIITNLINSTVASEICDVDKIDFISSGVAAAITYYKNIFLKNKISKDQRIVFYDIGAGSFVYTIVTIKSDKIIVESENIDFDKLTGNILTDIIYEYLENLNLLTKSLKNNKYTICHELLLQLNDKLKFNFDFMHFEDENDEKKFLSLDKDDCKKYILNKIDIKLFKFDEINKKNLDVICYIGGVTQLDFLKEFLNKNFNIPIKINAENEDYVAKGARIYAIEENNLNIENYIKTDGKQFLDNIDDLKQSFKTEIKEIQLKEEEEHKSEKDIEILQLLKYITSTFKDNKDFENIIIDLTSFLINNKTLSDIKDDLEKIKNDIRKKILNIKHIDLSDYDLNKTKNILITAYMTEVEYDNCKYGYLNSEEFYTLNDKLLKFKLNELKKISPSMLKWFGDDAKDLNTDIGNTLRLLSNSGIMTKNNIFIYDMYLNLLENTDKVSFLPITLNLYNKLNIPYVKKIY